MSLTTIVFQQEPVPGLLSIIIPVAWDAEGLEVTLRSLRAQIAPDNAGVEIIVANDGGDAEIASVCQRYHARHVSLLPNQGSYAARNAALATSRGEHIAFIDADEMVTRDWLPSLRKALTQADYVAGAVFIDEAQIVSLAHRLDAMQAFRVARELATAGYGPTANLAVSRRLIDAIGGFDPRLRSGGDAEFGSRVRNAGFRQIYEPAAVVLHPPRSLRQQIGRIRRYTTARRVLHRLFPDRFEPAAVVFNPIRLLRPRRLPVGEAGPVPLTYREKGGLVFLGLVLRLAQIYFLLDPRERYDSRSVGGKGIKKGRVSAA